MKPRIFINMHYMALGGAERALLGLLNAIDTNRVDVDLFLNQHSGEFMPLIPDKINLLPEKKGYNAIERPMKTILKEGQLGVLFGRLKAKWQHNNYYKSLSNSLKSFDSSTFQYVADCVEPFLPSLNNLGEYDLAISFMQPHNIVLNKVKARKKLAWIHTDYSAVHFNAEKELPIWSRYDHIVSISPECTKAFLTMFPTLKDKIIEIENILSPIFVRQQANVDTTSIYNNFDGVKLLSVGRICYAKNYDNIPDIANKIKQSGIKFKWYIIGPGNHAEIDSLLNELDCNDVVEFLGAKSNPYPYMKACDIYVQPSRYEGKSVTVREAQMLCKPVVITNYATAKSQINHEVDGVIVPMDNDGISKGIIDFIHNKNLQDNIIEYLNCHDYGNEKEIYKIYNLIDIEAQ